MSGARLMNMSMIYDRVTRYHTLDCKAIDHLKAVQFGDTSVIVQPDGVDLLRRETLFR
jgi:hypothetical protein